MANRALDELLDLAIDAMLAGSTAGAADPELASLLGVASVLRVMPAEGLESRLRADLERRARMTATSLITGIREGFRTITPYLIVPDGARLLDFLKHSFGAEELSRFPAGDGFHAEARIGDSMLMIGSGEQVRGRERLAAFHVFVPDCDAAFRRAIEAGATSMGEPADRPYGERSGFVRDFAGNRWYISTRFASTPVPENSPSLIAYAHPEKARVYIDFLKRAFGAEEMFVAEHGGKVMHAAVRVGDGVLEMGEAPEIALPSRLFLYVDDCDTWYRSAIAAGATSIQEPTDQTYGHRTALVLDPIGCEWCPASLLK